MLTREILASELFRRSAARGICPPVPRARRASALGLALTAAPAAACGVPDADYSGYDFWLQKLNQFNGNYLDAEMVKAFINSDEYRHRLGP